MPRTTPSTDLTYNLTFAFILLSCLIVAPVHAVKGTDDADFERKLLALKDRARSNEMRIKAMDDLMMFYSTKAFPYFLAIVKDSREKESLRAVAAQKMVQINQQEAEKAFAQILDNKKENVFSRRLAVAELVRSSPLNMRTKIRELLSDPKEDPAIRQFALGTYASWEEPGRLHKIRDLVISQSESPGMRINALFKLEELNDLDFVKEQVRNILMNKSAPKELRKNSILLATRLEDPNAVPLIMRVVKDPNEPYELRKMAIRTIGSLGDEGNLTDLQTLLRYEMDEVLNADLKSSIEMIRERAEESQPITSTNLSKK